MSRSDTQAARDRRFALACLAALIAVLVYWWPAGLEFRSDDYLAVTYARDRAHVWHDFVGPYQGAERLALFYRPLITLSVAVDTWFGGTHPFWPHMMNVLVHVVNASLLFALLATFAPRGAALAAATYWALQPAHAGAVSWMIGRVDTHATMFYLAALLAERARHCGWIRTRIPGLFAFVLGACTKETCLTLPLAVWLLALASDRKPLGPRLRDATRAALPFWWVLVGVVALRYAVLGETIGGYAAAIHLRVTNALEFWRPLLPLESVWQIAGTLAALVVVAIGARKRLDALLVSIVGFVILALPAAGASATRDSKTRRYDYLPSIGVAAGSAIGGPLAPLLLIAAQAPAALDRRQTLRALGAEVRRIRAATAATLQSSDRSTDPVWIDAPAALHGEVLFHVGTDRLGVPPFGPGGRLVFPRRPIYPGVPEQRVGPRSGTHPAFYHGPARLDRAGLASLAAGTPADIGLRGIEATAVHAWRAVVATPLGWLVTEVPANGKHTVDVRTLLLSRPSGLPANSSSNLLLDLWPALETSLDPRPRIWLEALAADGTRIATSKAPLTLPLTRDIGLGLVAKRPRLWILLLLAAGAAFVGVRARKAP